MRRIAVLEEVNREFAAWEKERNSQMRKIKWQVAVDNACIKVRHLHLIYLVF